MHRGCKSSEGDQGNQELAAPINLPGWLLQGSLGDAGSQCSCGIENKPVYALRKERKAGFGHFGEKVAWISCWERQERVTAFGAFSCSLVNPAWVTRALCMELEVLAKALLW